MELGAFSVGDEFVGDYLRAVGDRCPVYAEHRLVPPVALIARALGSVLDHLDLPPGAIHSVQEIYTLSPVAWGQRVTGVVEVGPPRRRGGLELIAAEIRLALPDGAEAVRGKSTVVAQRPTAGASEASRETKSSPPGGAVPAHRNGDDEWALPAVTRTITREQLSAYAEVSGDRNPLHLDPGFAAATQFGGVIAHGMLTLAFISEMMAAAFGKAWLESGETRVRFKGAAYPGRAVLAGGSVEKDEESPEGRRLSCAVAVRDQQDGQELVSGTAVVRL